MHPVQAEYPLIKTYLEWLTDLPWNTTTTGIELSLSSNI